MLQNDRRRDIVRLLREKGSVTVKELSALLYASPATIRRDLSVLEESGELTRSFGGASLREEFPDETPAMLRMSERIQQKKRAAAYAATLVHAGQTVFIDASTTTYLMIPHLRRIPELTVITNSPRVCVALAESPVHCLCTGGEMLSLAQALIGTDAVRYVSGIRAHAFFFSARGVDSTLISDSSRGERDIKQAMLENSAKAYFLYDCAKFGQSFPYVVCPLSRADALITEEGIRKTDENGK